mgnify:FL=1
MGETLGDGALAGGALEGVVADRLGGAQPLLHVTGLEQIMVVGRPDTGEAIGLQLHLHLLGIAGGGVAALLGGAHLVRNADERLDVMAHLMCDHIGLRKIAGRAEAGAQLVEEARVEIDAIVGGAVEGAHCGFSGTAARFPGAVV